VIVRVIHVFGAPCIGKPPVTIRRGEESTKHIVDPGLSNGSVSLFSKLLMTI
jgi:hypothetical protein